MTAYLYELCPSEGPLPSWWFNDKPRDQRYHFIYYVHCILALVDNDPYLMDMCVYLQQADLWYPWPKLVTDEKWKT